MTDMATADEKAADNTSSYITLENEMSKLNDAEQRQNPIIVTFKTNGLKSELLYNILLCVFI